MNVLRGRCFERALPELLLMTEALVENSLRLKKLLFLDQRQQGGIVGATGKLVPDTAVYVIGRSSRSLGELCLWVKNVTLPLVLEVFVLNARVCAHLQPLHCIVHVLGHFEVSVPETSVDDQIEHIH